MATQGLKLIASHIASATENSYTFTSIPQTYTHLLLRTSARDTIHNGGHTYAYLGINGGGATYYTWFGGYGYGGSAGTLSLNTANGVLTVGTADAEADTYSNIYSSGELYVFNYTSSSGKISWTTNGVSDSNTINAMSTVNAGHTVGSAVTSLLMSSQTNFVAGTSFYLYGIKNS